MKQLVVDSSAIVAALVDAGPEGIWVRSSMNVPALEAPEIAIVEACNVLRRLEMNGIIPEHTAAAAFSALKRFPINVWPFHDMADRVWELRKTMTSYDAALVALAEKIDAPLLTLDKRLSNAPGSVCTFLTPPVDL